MLRDQVIADLLDFMVEFERTRSFDIYRGTCIAEAKGPILPESLAVPLFAQLLAK